MKVLFAVNNDKISEAVIKKYPKDYKELLSYKNVYYFNAILKEIQNDKSYDRIVISEDLEPFVNTNHDSIDNFLFNNLDKISDEAQGTDGREISIILICSERRTFGSNILNKLFSIGIYNALIGNDRSMDNLCKLINRPRTKKEAKVYYRIDQATYESAVDNGEVSETEIQNILNHFKKLGKSTERYTDSFNNIAAQYTDDQLKLIINVLPMKVKAVLEAESEKYQTLMGTSGEARQAVGPAESGIRVNTIGNGRENNINGPIVIPSGIKRFTNGGTPIRPQPVQSRPQPQARPEQQAQPAQVQQPQVRTNPVQQPQAQQPQVRPVQIQQPVQQQVQQPVQQRPVVQANPVQSNNIVQRPVQNNGPIIPNNVAKVPTVSQLTEKEEPVQPVQPELVSEPEDVSIPGLDDLDSILPGMEDEPETEDATIPGLEDTSDDEILPGMEEEPKIPEPVQPEPVQPEPVQPEPTPATAVQSEQKHYTGTIAQVKRTLIARRKATPQTATPNPVVEQPVIPTIPGMAEENENVEEVRRGRGRPRKPVTETEIKPKGKRGRPRKISEEDNSNIDDLLGGLGSNNEDNEITMPGLEEPEDTLPGLEETGDTLPGLEETEDTLPGVEDSGTLPGLEDDSTDDGMLPGLDDTSDDGTLPGLEDTVADESNDTILPGMEDEPTDSGELPGLDETEDNDGEGEEVDVNSLLAGLDDVSSDDSDNSDDSLPGLDGDLDSILPGMEDEPETEDTAIPGLEDASDDGMIPGMGDEPETDDVSIPGLDDEEDNTIPGLDDNTIPGMEDESDDGMIPGLDDTSDDGMLPGMEDNTETGDVSIPGLDDEEDNTIPGLDEPDDSGTLPGMDDDDLFSSNTASGTETDAIESIKPQVDYSMSNLNSLLSKDKKIVAFVGATKNGTSFLINNLALMFSMMGVDTAILDMTQNKNSYYLFTDSREELRKIAYTSLSKLENGYADGIKFNKNLTVYTGLPSDTTVYENAEPILSTLIQNHSLVLIDTDFTTPPAYFASSQEIYLVQSMDILTIQPLTAFLRELKFKGAWEPEKARVVINKEVPIRILSNKTIIGGMSRYNGPDMSVMTDLFNKDMVKACSIPFDEKVYAKYLETLATCKLSISSLPKQFRAKLQILGEMVYPRLNSKTSYNPSPMGGANYVPQENAFSNDTNNTLDKMKKNF